MRIDLPRCDIVECKWYSDGNCTSQKAYQRCVYPDKKRLLDELDLARKTNDIVKGKE